VRVESGQGQAGRWAVNDDQELKTAIGGRIKQARLAAGMSQETLATLAGVDRSMVSLWERAAHSPGAVTVVRLAEALGVPVGWLLLGEGRDGG
jgi:XRE family transcriptional regulator, regulator of sulfur utilization